MVSAPSVSKEVFQAAVTLVQNMPKDGEVQLSNDQKLEFYALFKQATIGQCNTIRPTMWNVVERYKWDAWSALGNLNPERAQDEYVSRLGKIMSKFLAKQSVKELLDDPKWQGIRPVVEPQFEILGPVMGFVTPSQMEQPSSSKSEEDITTMESVYNEIITESEVPLLQPHSNPMSEDEYVDAREDSPVIVNSRDIASPSSIPPDDPISRSLTFDLVNSFQLTTKLITQQIQALSSVFQHQNQVIIRYLEKLGRSGAISWPLLLILLIWPVIVQLAIRYFFGPR